MSCFTTTDLGGCGCGCSPVTFTVVCGTTPVVGASVSVSSGGTTVASGTTNGSGQATLAIPSAGTYTVAASGGTPNCNPGFSGSMALACGATYTLQCCCTEKVCVTACPTGAAIAGASVAIKSGGTTVSSGTTDSTGCVILNIPSGGSYELIVTASGYKGYDGTRTLACGGTASVVLQPNTANATIKFQLTGCCNLSLAGVSIALSDGQTATTDAAGAASFWQGTAGTYSYTASKSRFVSATGNVTVTGCQTTTTTVNITLSPATGYHCGPKCSSASPQFLADPVPDTLFLTDSAYGATTLAYSATGGPGGTAGWSGTLTATFPEPAGYPAGVCPASTTFTITYRLGVCSNGRLQVSYPGTNCGQCFGGGTFGSNPSYQMAADPIACTVPANPSIAPASATFGDPTSSVPGTCTLAGIPLVYTRTLPSSGSLGTFTLAYPPGSSWTVTE